MCGGGVGDSIPKRNAVELTLRVNFITTIFVIKNLRSYQEPSSESQAMMR